MVRFAEQLRHLFEDFRLEASDVQWEMVKWRSSKEGIGDPTYSSARATENQTTRTEIRLSSSRWAGTHSTLRSTADFLPPVVLLNICTDLTEPGMGTRTCRETSGFCHAHSNWAIGHELSLPWEAVSTLTCKAASLLGKLLPSVREETSEQRQSRTHP